MKFEALALAFLLSAGCQPMVSFSFPSRYEIIRGVVVTILIESKEFAQKAVAKLDDAEFKDFKIRFNMGLDSIETEMNSAAEFLAPVRKIIGPQIVEFLFYPLDQFSYYTVEMREELWPKCAELLEVVKKHLQEYRTLLEPALKEYSDKNQEVVEEFKAKFEPVVKELKEKIKVNLEETKSKLTPMVEVIRTHLTKILEELKITYGPHVQEHREQIESTYIKLRHEYESGELKKKFETLSAELRPKLQDIYNTIEKAFKA